MKTPEPFATAIITTPPPKLAEDANREDFVDWLNRHGWKEKEPDALDAYLFALVKAARVMAQKSEQPSTPPASP